MLKVSDLHARVEEKEILKGVSIELTPGSIVVITGPNGSGKSTLARTIMGDERIEVTSGSIEVEGEDITDLPPEERFKKSVFMTFQLPPEFEGIRIGDFMMKVSGREDISAIKEMKELLKRVGLDESFLFRELHRGLSGGERKRLELFQALFLKPKYIILDEIDSGVDIESVRKMVEIVKEMKERGHAILYITHNPLSLELLKDETILKMEGGKIVDNNRKG